METLKMKFKLHALEFEIEGKHDTVIEEFGNFKIFVKEELLSKLNIITTQVTAINQERVQKQLELPQDVFNIDQSKYPTLKEVIKRDIPKNEPDWVLIYCFYASGFGEKSFTEKNIKDLYKTSERRMMNFERNIKAILNKKYIKMQNDTDYIIKEVGIKHSINILNGHSAPKAITRSTKSEKKDKQIEEKRNKPTKVNSTDFVDLQLQKDDLNALISFFKGKNPKTQNEEAATVMKWYKDFEHNADISLSEINYLLKICSKTPKALEQVIINMKGAKYNWVVNTNNGRVKLTSIGENYVDNKLPGNSNE